MLDIDVKGFFDSIDWELLLKAVRSHTDCPWVLLYIERWLKAPVQMEDGNIVPRTAGTPQGGVISPLLANLFLHYAFDMWMAREFPHIPFERYADDAICHCKSAEEARALWSALADRFAACKLALHPEKTKIVYCKDVNRRGNFPAISFDFLGFQFRARKTMWQRRAVHGFLPAASPKALTRIGREIRHWALHHRSDKSLEELAAIYNPIVRGWIGYYGNFTGRNCVLPCRGSISMSFAGHVANSSVSSIGPRDKRLVRPGTPYEPHALCPLAAMSWKRPDIGSRVTREGHARFWERLEVKLLRATRQYGLGDMKSSHHRHMHNTRGREAFISLWSYPWPLEPRLSPAGPASAAEMVCGKHPDGSAHAENCRLPVLGPERPATLSKVVLLTCALRWLRSFGQFFRFDKWSVCQG